MVRALGPFPHPEMVNELDFRLGVQTHLGRMAVGHTRPDEPQGTREVCIQAEKTPAGAGVRDGAATGSRSETCARQSACSAGAAQPLACWARRGLEKRRRSGMELNEALSPTGPELTRSRY